VALSVAFNGRGWSLPSPLFFEKEMEVWKAETPGELAALLRRLHEVSCSADPDLLAAGFISYEAGVLLEGSEALFRPPEGLPLAVFGLFRRSFSRSTPRSPDFRGEPLVPEPSFSFEEWCLAVRAIRDGIARGDVYQVNLTRRMRFLGNAEPFALASALYTENPVPYAMTLAGDGFAVVSNSPELFLHVDLRRGEVRSSPIKGTVAKDGVGARERLLASEKDAAEHLMIVDLIRNDLGRVAVPGGVCVPLFRSVKSFRHLHHLESTVMARLRPGAGLSDILAATLPGGSITGAPKRAALRFIRDLEPCARGPYTGAAGFVTGDGRAVFNVAIRTAVASGGKVDYHAGGGIVWDSDSAAEWEETEIKSREFAAALAAVNEAAR
jgi:anthranilate/para-aminobenzoate synthase component I